MSYITDIRDTFSIISSGTFLFTSEVRADDSARNLPKSAFPIFVIDDEPLTTDIRINTDASLQDDVKLKVYCLTKYDTLGNEIEEGNSTRLEQHEGCVVSMKDLAVRVMAKYMRENTDVIRQNGVRPTFSVTDRYNMWSKMLYGVELRVSNMWLRRITNYCDL